MPSRRLAAACLLLAFAADALARLEDDRFSVEQVDTCRWFDWSATASSPYGNGQKVSTGAGLKLMTDSAELFSHARIISQYALTGDMSMEIRIGADASFHAAIPANAQKYAAFGLWVDETRFLFISLALARNQPVIRALRSDFVDGSPRMQVAPDIPIATLPNALRVEQVQRTVTLSYRIGDAWRTAAQWPAFSERAHVLIQASTIDVRQEFAVTFQDFTVTSGDTTLRPYVRDPSIRREDFMRGVILGDYLDWKLWGQTRWQRDPHAVLAGSGVNWIKTNLTTVSSPDLARLPPEQWRTLAWSGPYWRSYELTAELLKRARAAGHKLYLELYLSDGPADAGRQHAPAAWAGLTLDETAAAAKRYAQDLARRLKADGIAIDLWGIGNETDPGFIGFATTPGDRLQGVPRDLPYDTYLRTQVWPIEAVLLKAVIDGIRSEFPAAKTVLHVAGLAHWTPGDVFTKAFFRTMVDQGVPFDHAAISLPYADYPWPLDRYSTDCWYQRLQETTDYIASLGKPTIITEGSYPNIADGWTSQPMVDFPYTAAGQAGWLRELLRFGNNNPNVLGFFYWAAEYYPGLGDASTVPAPQYEGLFDANEAPLPALAEFGVGKATRTTTIDCLFDWAQLRFPDLFAGPATPTSVFGPYSYRHYAGSGAYLGRSGPNVHYLGPASANALLDLGPTAGWLGPAGCQ